LRPRRPGRRRGRALGRGRRAAPHASRPRRLLLCACRHDKQVQGMPCLPSRPRQGWASAVGCLCGCSAPGGALLKRASWLGCASPEVRKAGCAEAHVAGGGPPGCRPKRGRRRRARFTAAASTRPKRSAPARRIGEQVRRARGPGTVAAARAGAPAPCSAQRRRRCRAAGGAPAPGSASSLSSGPTAGT